MIHYIWLQFGICFDPFNRFVSTHGVSVNSRERRTGCVRNWIRGSKWYNQWNKSHLISPFVVPVVIIWERSFPDIHTPQRYQMEITNGGTFIEGF